MLFFGTAGIPITTQKKSSINGIKRVRELGLDALELEFVYGVKMSKTLAQKIKMVAKEHNVHLTAHGPYYINLNSLKRETVKASIDRILKTARTTKIAGGKSITFHVATYGEAKPESVYKTVKEHLSPIIKALQEEGNNVWIRPETTGKKSQFGTLGELIKLSQEIEQVLPAVDFAHLNARTNGESNRYQHFESVLSKLENGLGREILDNMHIHISGVEYSPKGEIRHITLAESDINYEELIKSWKDYKIKGIVISESPNIEFDALLLKKIYESKTEEH
ncbi:MAG: TIM barrel protein [Candidatus Freyarchaeum deiterrae]